MVSKVMGFVMKNIMTESLVKSVVGVLGDYLVASSKNKLDDALWSKVKKSLKNVYTVIHAIWKQ